MYYWFQNLKKDDRSKRLFHFRGSVGSDYRRSWFKYELRSGPTLSLKYQHGEADDGGESSMLVLGALFFTAYLTFYLPPGWYFRKKCVATWKNNETFYLTDGREYGFYFYEWAFVWHWHKKIHESSSSDPWWMDIYFHIDDFFLGRTEVLTDELTSADNIFFKLGDKEFCMQSIQWKRRRRFRRHIPYSLYHSNSYSVEMKIDKPPMRAGKGENSYDCDDDGSFGLSGPWKYEKPTWKNRDDCTKKAIEYYVESFRRDANKYGASSGERGVSRDAELNIIGRKATP